MRTFITTFALLISIVTYARSSSDSLPGNSKLPSSKTQLDSFAQLDKGIYKYSIEDYFAKPKQFSFQFSPNGKFVSFREKDENGKNNVYAKNVENNKTIKVISEGKELIRQYGWVNNTRLFYIQDQGGNENYQLFAVDIDGTNLKSLTPFNNVTVSIIKILKEQPDYMIIQMNKDNPQIFEPYKLNINTGALLKLFENKDTISPIDTYVFDKDGDLRAYIKIENSTDNVLYYRTSSNDSFEKVVKLDWKDNFEIIDFDYTSSNKHAAFVVTNLYSNTNEILLYDLKEKKIINKIYSNATFDIDGLETSRKRGYEVDYYYYTDEKLQIVPVSKTFKILHQKITNRFKNKQYVMPSKTDDEYKYLIYVSSDKLYGTYYVYDAIKDSFQKIIDLKPELKEDDMGEMRPIKFESRDGLLIYGYLTLPKDYMTLGKIPLIVNPHGGPYGIRDYWGFNPETQLFASRGYATLQVNYRGSGGYGKKFYLAGNNQIGRKMLDDLEDGVAYVKSQGWIDKDKIAIYGGSYGGLATLGSLVKTPDLYTCGVDYVGVSNLFTFYKSFPPYWKPYMRQVYEQWYNPEKEDEKKIMTEVSPALNVDKMKKPLFVIQGSNDPRVNINESDQIVKSLRENGFDVPYMVKYNEGHGFGHDENRIDLYKAMMGFFAKHLK